ncbi:MAG: VWA domain-containing protein, partial [Pseudomonadota bacterium]
MFSLIYWKTEKGFYLWIHKYWFLRKTRRAKVASFLYYLSLCLLIVAVLDLRGPEKKKQTEIPDQRTIILIDISNSMLVEDVMPSRFDRALVARHFVQKAAGHQISIVLFSDMQRRLLPFTDDVDLLDSRIAGLSSMKLAHGGSNISQAIQEALSYFQLEAGGQVQGNLLLITDGEENEDEFLVKIPNSVNFAVVGVGTLKGGIVPVKDYRGEVAFTKKFKGEEVISRLDEDWIKKIGRGVKNFHYWIINSGSIPTEEVLSFFRDNFKNNLATGTIRTRPVYSNFIVICAILLLLFATVLRFGKTLKTHKKRNRLFKMLVPFFMICHSNISFSEDVSCNFKDQEIIKAKEELKIGDISQEGILKVAETFARKKCPREAEILYA